MLVPMMEVREVSVLVVYGLMKVFMRVRLGSVGSRGVLILVMSATRKKVRNVPQDMKEKVYVEYGIANRAPRKYEVDHLIGLELGGSNSIKNLWPQSYLTQLWNAHVKDRLENKLHAMVVSGQIDLPTAQKMIAANWIAAHKQIFHTDQPLTSESSQRRVSARHHPTSARVSNAIPVPRPSRN